MPKIHQTSSRTSLLGQWCIFVGIGADFLNAIFMRPIPTTNVHGFLIQLLFLCAPKIRNTPQNLPLVIWSYRFRLGFSFSADPTLVLFKGWRAHSLIARR